MLKSVALDSAVFKRLPALISTLRYSTEPQKHHSFRTEESDPRKHSLEHVGQFYKIPSTESKLFLFGGFSKRFEQQRKTFNETCLMVRKPSLDIINCLKAVDYTKPAVKFVIYGKDGTGKSVTLAHVIHYAQKAGFLLVHIPWVGVWMQNPKERSSSERREGFIDLNMDAAAWLIHFKSQNEHLWTSPDLRTTKEHVWSKREVTPKDSPLVELIDHGINRIKYASDCVAALVEDLKALSNAGHCKTLVAINGFNAFFQPKSNVLIENKVMIPPSKVTLTESFLNLTQADWNNGAVVVTADELAMAEEDRNISHLPKFLLTKAGFEHLDPFVPIGVGNYSAKEFLSCMDYYRERKWVVPVANQDEELAFLTSNNPLQLMLACTGL